MAEQTSAAPDSSTMRHIRDARDIGASSNGQKVVLNLQMEDGSTEWFAMQHPRVGRLLAALMFGAGVAANDRATVAGRGGAPAAELSTLIEITRINASSAPGSDHIALRVVVGEGVNLDFRIPLAIVPALQEKITGAAAAAGSSGSSAP